MPAPDMVAPGRGLVGAPAFTLTANLSRGLPIISLVADLIIAAVLYGAWIRAGRPRGIHNVAAEAEEMSE